MLTWMFILTLNHPSYKVREYYTRLFNVPAILLVDTHYVHTPEARERLYYIKLWQMKQLEMYLWKHDRTNFYRYFIDWNYFVSDREIIQGVQANPKPFIQVYGDTQRSFTRPPFVQWDYESYNNWKLTRCQSMMH